MEELKAAIKGIRREKEELERELLARIAEAINQFQEATDLRVSAVAAQFIDARGLGDSGPRPILAGVEGSWCSEQKRRRGLNLSFYDSVAEEICLLDSMIWAMLSLRDFRLNGFSRKPLYPCSNRALILKSSMYPLTSRILACSSILRSFV